MGLKIYSEGVSLTSMGVVLMRGWESICGGVMLWRGYDLWTQLMS